MKSGIYRITNKRNGRVYIGSSQDVKTRMRKHRWKLNRDKHENVALQNGWNKHGEDSFEFSVVLICAVHDLIMYEQIVMDYYKAAVKPFGYNIRPKAESNVGMFYQRTRKPGEKFGRLTLIERRDKFARGRKWLCRCDCGNEVVVDVHSVSYGETSSCGCLQKEVLRQKRHKHKAGEKYNRLTFVSPKEVGCEDSTAWLVRCDCGAEKYLSASRVSRGVVESCGCLIREVNSERSRTHGLSATKEYSAWLNMRRRCYEPGNISYWAVGARGITVCKRWMKFENFIEDMGKCPTGKSLQRIDNSGNFKPDNCKWATKTEQMKGNHRAKFVIVGGNSMNVGDAERLLGIHRSSINQKVRQSGKTYQQATDHFAAKVKS